MNTKHFRTLLVAALVASPLIGFSAETAAPKAAAPGALLKKEPASAQKELQTLVGKITAKMKEGKKTEADMADEVKEFDTLLANHKGEKSDDVVQILMMKAMLYTQVFGDTAKGDALKAQLIKDYPESSQAKNIARQEEADKLKNSFVVGAKFPDFTEKDVDGKPMSISKYKGKVVLVDFWATWCGPCVKELPNVLATYEKHHKGGFDIVGISLDQSEEKLRAFTKDKNMTWQQYFDGKGWQRQLGGQYGVNSIPATYLLDGNGVIIGKDLRGEDLEKAVAAALAKK